MKITTRSLPSVTSRNTTQITIFETVVQLEESTYNNGKSLYSVVLPEREANGKNIASRFVGYNASVIALIETAGKILKEQEILINNVR